MALGKGSGPESRRQSSGGWSSSCFAFPPHAAPTGLGAGSARRSVRGKAAEKAAGKVESSVCRLAVALGLEWWGTGTAAQSERELAKWWG
jgi:hypothetical protein